MTINHRRTFLVSSFLLVALSGALPGSPVGTASAVEVIYSECQIESGHGSCSFDCAPGLRIEVEHKGADGSMLAECSTTDVAHCNDGPCTGQGTSFSQHLDGHCTAWGDSGPAACRAVVGTPHVESILGQVTDLDLDLPPSNLSDLSE